MRKILLGLLILGVLQSCVTSKDVYVSELKKNFEAQKHTFIEKKGLDITLNSLDVYFSDELIDKEYEVVSYNHVNSWLPFRAFTYNKWELKYRLHQYMHNAYCLGILESVDAIVVDSELSGVKYIRYKDSKKEPFVIPEAQPFSSSINLGGGLSFARSGVLNGSYAMSKNIDCLRGRRREFGFNFGLNKVTEATGSKNMSDGFFNLNYKYIFSYNLSEYFSSTWNIGNGKRFVYSEVGFDFNLYNRYNTNTTITSSGGTELSRSKTINTDFIQLGGYAGLRYAISEKLNVSLGISSNPLGIISFEDNISIVSGNKSSVGTSKFTSFGFNTNGYLRLHVNL